MVALKPRKYLNYRMNLVGRLAIEFSVQVPVFMGIRFSSFCRCPQSCPHQMVAVDGRLRISVQPLAIALDTGAITY
jgi:hypothetical protein